MEKQKMRVIKAIIKQAPDSSYSIYTKEMDGIVGSGLTEQEAVTNFKAVVAEAAEHCKKTTGQCPNWAKNGYIIAFRHNF